MRIYQPVDGPDKLPQAMVEASTEYDWAELPDRIQAAVRHAAREIIAWSEMQDSPIVGEVVPETFADRMAARSLDALSHESWRAKQ